MRSELDRRAGMCGQSPMLAAAFSSSPPHRPAWPARPRAVSRRRSRVEPRRPRNARDAYCAEPASPGPIVGGVTRGSTNSPRGCGATSPTARGWKL
jgi:hypothetical protein